MAKKLPFQLYEARDIAGLVKENNLAYNFGIEPQKASEVAIRLMEANVGMDMNTYLSKFPVKKFKTSDDFYWDIETGGDKNVGLVKAESVPGSAVTATDQLGKNFSEFYLYFDEAWFTDVNVIVGEELEKYQIQILEDPHPVGTLFRYRCRLLTGDPNLYIPYEEVQAGKRFSKDFSLVEQTMSVKGGGIHHDFPYKMLNAMSMIRMEDTVPGNMIVRPTLFSWKHPKTGKVMTMWMDKWTADFEIQYMKEINHLLMYAQSNKSADGTYKQKGKSGNVIKQGAGLKQQIEQANYYTYNEFDIDKFVDMLLELSVGKIVQGQREVTISTGEWGMVEFHKAIEDRTALFTPARDNYRIYSGAGGAKDGMGFRGQFTEYYGPNGVKVNIIHDPTKDDPVRNKKKHPTKSGLLESYNYDILNMGTSDGSPNIQKVTLEQFGEIRKFRPGLRSPYDLKGNSSEIMVTSVDAWEEHRAFTGGVMVADPSRTGVYKIAVD